MSFYAIHEPVAEVPPPVTPGRERREGWSLAYRAAVRAAGLWTPVVFQERSDARRLAEAAGRLSSTRFDAEVRGATCFLRVRV